MQLDEDAARTVLKDITRFRALAIGPGLGRDDRAQAAVRRLIAEAPMPIVVDADALNALAIDPSALRVRHAAGLAPAILTPHDGEYERLAGRAVGDDRVAAARDLARRTEAVVLLKGPATVIAAPIRRCLREPDRHRCARDRGNGRRAHRHHRRAARERCGRRSQRRSPVRTCTVGPLARPGPDPISSRST